MPQLSGNLHKMRTEFGSPIQYHLHFEEGELRVNDLLGKKISIEFNGRINCVSCGKITKKSFGGGFCYPCFATAPESAECIIRPELCEGHLGKGRDPEWEERHHVQPHYVYLALSSGLKVGITRDTQIPTRWIDQGASSAIILAEVPYRRLSGDIEVALKEFHSDRTNWQRMLKNEVLQDDLIIRKQEAKNHLPSDLQQYVTDDKKIWQLEFPSLDTPLKVKSQKLEKVFSLEGVLTGIKGQYLIFDNQNVINIRSHAGYQVSINY
ncbi:MAG: DUF2797 domain-containing protein [Flavobacteriales bacterium]|nr:DUF2797 domain-containing protein [Flavobacteriales bacterium]